MSTLPSIAQIGSPTLAKRGIKALLLEGPFAEALATVTALHGDGLDMPPLRAVATAELRTLTAELPAAEILLINSVPTSPGGSIYEHTLAVRFYVGGDDEQVITDQAERYVLACRHLFGFLPGREALVFPFVGGTVTPGTEDYDPTVQRKQAEASLVKVGAIELTVRTVN